jgi:hypothetical protein
LDANSNFSTSCDFGDFTEHIFWFPPGTPADPLFEEPITIDMVVEADDELDLNVFPLADFVLRGQD